MNRVALTLLVFVTASPPALAGPKPHVYLADQGNNNGTNNRIIEIDPYLKLSPAGPDGEAVVIRYLPSPAGAFLDELDCDPQGNLWCVVKNTPDQQQDGATLINRQTGAILRQIYPFIPGHTYGSYLEGLAWDGEALWVTGVRGTGTGDPNGNVMTRVDPITGNRTTPFTEGTLAGTEMCKVPGNIAQGLLYEPGGTHGYLWHSDVGLNRIYKLDLSRLYDADPGNDNNLSIADYLLPVSPKGMAWFDSETIWFCSPRNGVWEFKPATGDRRRLWSTPNWNLDGLAIWYPFPGDYDDDGDVDLTDFGTFQLCFNGPTRPYPFSGCGVADTDDDGDVDLSDFATFLSCFNGPEQPPSASCPH